MQYLTQAAIIFGFTLLGELCHTWIPLPIPTAIWGLVLLFAALVTKLVKPEQIAGVAKWLIAVMAVLFVAPGVNLMSVWEVLSDNLVGIAAVTAVSTVVVFVVAGKVTQWLLGGDKNA